MADAPQTPVQTPVPKIIQSIFWPVSVWPSFGHMEAHPADDYVERTTPIMSTAVGFWICAGSVLALWLASQTGILARIDIDGVTGSAVRVPTRGVDVALGVLMFFLPLLYIAGFWMFHSREDDYPN